MEINVTEKQAVISAMAAAFKDVQGVAAIVLGGSQAAGYATERSDVDLGLYYFEEKPFSIESIREVADRFSIQGPPLVTGFYEWGPWVNGGAWLETRAGKVDLLYRNINQVQQTITDAANGIWYHHFDQQPPFGFRSVIYLAETQVCIPLFDPGNVIQQLKEQVTPYPARLKQAVISDCLWLAEFTLMQCDGFADAADVYNTTGCFTRIAHYLVHALFAVNETYPLGDKRAIRLIEGFKQAPQNFREILHTVLGNAGTGAVELAANAGRLKTLWEEVVKLTGGQYQPRFNSISRSPR